MPAAAPAAPAPAPVRGPGRFRRLLEWFWRGRAIRELKATGGVGMERASELLKRGWLCVELAERALRPTPLLVNGAADGPARELLCQAVYWALRAGELAAASRRGETATEAGPAGLRQLWQRAERPLLEDAAGGEGAAKTLEASLLVERFSDFAELAPEEQARQARDLAVFARTLLTNLEVPRVRVDKLLFQRVLRTGGLFAVCASLALFLAFARNWRERERDYAIDKPYKASSVYPAVGCKSPQQDCPESPFYFFHTLEEERPWLEIDLGSKKRLSAIKLVNREDCCGERAVPIGVEISNDRKTWREVARRTEPFTSWYTAITPVSARYIRAVGLRKTALHLKRFSALR